MKLSKLHEAKYAGQREIDTAYVLYDQEAKAYLELGTRVASGMSRRLSIEQATWWRNKEHAQGVIQSKKKALIHDLESKKYHEGKTYFTQGRWAREERMTARQAKLKNASIKKQLKVYDAIKVAEIKVYL